MNKEAVVMKEVRFVFFSKDGSVWIFCCLPLQTALPQSKCTNLTQWMKKQVFSSQHKILSEWGLRLSYHSRHCRMCWVTSTGNTGFIVTLVNDMIPVVTVRSFPKQKAWIKGPIHTCCCLWLRTCVWDVKEYKAVSSRLRHAIKVVQQTLLIIIVVVVSTVLW